MKKIIYHGSDHIIEQPEFGYGKPYNDYGIGFYCTENPNMAKEWGVGIDHNGYANQYQINCDGLSILDLHASEYTLLHWLTILLENREFDTSTPLAAEAKEYLIQKFHLDYKSYDIIIGYRADDSYFSYARDFISGVISYEQLGKAMQLGSLGEQYCLKTEKAFQHLKFIAKEHVPSAEWYSKKMLRDRNARNGYKDMEKETYHRGELYISRIIDEEMKSDDLFLR